MPEVASPEVSVVMPMYNAERCIGEAIRCVQGQTFGGWELIVVDDASTDDSVRVARAQAGDDARVRVITSPENGGPASARNIGIAEARGRWLWMPDADDGYDAELLEDVLAAIDAAPFAPDAAIFGYVEEFFASDGTRLRDVSRPILAAPYVQGDDWRRLVIELERETQYGYPWNKLYRLDRIQAGSLAFERVRLIEDIAFNVAYFANVNGVAIIGTTPYHYAKREGSSLTNANEYGASEYWQLHERRISMLYDQLLGWGVLDDALPTLGSLYVRYVISTLERSYHAIERWDGAQRRRWLQKTSETSLFRKLVPCAQADSLTLSAAIAALRSGRAGTIIAMARAANLARTHAYAAFTKARSKR